MKSRFLMLCVTGKMSLILFKQREYGLRLCEIYGWSYESAAYDPVWLLKIRVLKCKSCKICARDVQNFGRKQLE